MELLRRYKRVIVHCKTYNDNVNIRVFVNELLRKTYNDNVKMKVIECSRS